MSAGTNRLSFLEELKRRNVVRIAAMYAVVAWLVIQIADATFEPLGITEGAHRVLILLTALGFPLALVLGYVFHRRHSFLAVVVLHAIFNAMNLIIALLKIKLGGGGS